MTTQKREISQLPWIRYDQNPFDLPLLDLRPITFRLTHTTDNEEHIRNLDSYNTEDGASFSGLTPESKRIVPADLFFKTEGKLFPGSLFVPKAHEHKWAIFFDGQYIYCVRSWTRDLVVRAKVENVYAEDLTEKYGKNSGEARHETDVTRETSPAEARKNRDISTKIIGIRVTEIEGEFLNEEPETAEETVALFHFLMVSHALNEITPVPLPTALEDEPNNAGVWAFSLFGNRAAVGTFDSTAIFPSESELRSTTAYHIAIANDDKESVKLILNQNLVPKNLLAQDGFTPIHWALYTDHLEMLELLHQYGVDIDLPSRFSVTPLMDAVEIRSLKAVETLLKLGAKVNQQDRKGFTALHRASEMGELEIVRKLLAAGADKSLKGEGNLDALAVAKLGKHPEVITLLERAELPQ